MRPATIIWFERLILATVALGILRSWLFPNNAWLSGIGDGGVMSNLIAAVLVVVVMLRVSRWRSKLAMWFAILWTVVTMPMVVTSAVPFGLYPATGAKVPGWAWLGMEGALLQVTACGLLFTRSARRWINRSRRSTILARPSPDPRSHRSSRETDGFVAARLTRRDGRLVSPS